MTIPTKTQDGGARQRRPTPYFHSQAPDPSQFRRPGINGIHRPYPEPPSDIPPPTFTNPPLRANDPESGFFHSHSIPPEPHQAFQPNYSNTFINQNGTSINNIDQQQAFTSLVTSMNSNMKRQTELMQESIQQKQLFHNEKKDRKIGAATKQMLLNAMTTDGVNPADSLSECAKSYMEAKDNQECRDLLERNLKSMDCQCEPTPSAVRSIRIGKPAAPRMRPGGVSIFGFPITLLNTNIGGIDFDQVEHDFEANRDITARERNAFTKTTLILPRTFYFMTEQMKNVWGFHVGYLLQGAKLVIFIRMFLDWCLRHRAILMNIQQEGEKDLPVKIAYQFDQIVNNYYLAAQTGVPSSTILDASGFMQQVLNGNFVINLPRTVLEILQPQRRQQANNNSQAKNLSLTTTSSKNTTNPRQGQANQANRVVHTNQPESLQISTREYALSIAPAIASKKVTVPTLNGSQECLKFALLAGCRDDCARKSTHIPVVAGEARERRLIAFKEHCLRVAADSNSRGNQDFQRRG